MRVVRHLFCHITTDTFGWSPVGTEEDEGLDRGGGQIAAFKNHISKQKRTANSSKRMKKNRGGPLYLFVTTVCIHDSGHYKNRKG